MFKHPYITGNYLSFDHYLSYNKHLSHSHQSHSHLSHSHLSHNHLSHSHLSHSHLSQNHHPFLSTQPSVAQCSTTAQAKLNHVSHNDQPSLTQHSTLYHMTFDPLPHSYQYHLVKKQKEHSTISQKTITHLLNTILIHSSC